MKFAHTRWLLFILALAACQPTPPPQPAMKIGKPYVISGKTYYPEYDPTYDKIGMASWYGPGFHGKYTASGEVFNQNDLTAAHPTLPMPSLVRVTNLENGKSLIVRINDRGPYKSNRIIDLSKKSAQVLGIRNTSQVRVQFLKKDTEDYIASLQNTGSKTSMVAWNDKVENAKDASVMQSTEPGTGQIVESTDASTHAGQVVSEAAPIMTVNAGNLAMPAAPKTQEASDKPAKPVRLIKEAKADEIDAPASPAVASDMPEPETGSITSSDVAPATPAPVKTATAPTPVAAPAAESNGHGYLIQVGSFAAEENAQKLQHKLDSIAALAIDKIEMKDKIWWRVRLGPFADKPAAEDALNSVRAAGLPDARIISQ